MAKADLTADELRSILSYDPYTGAFTRTKNLGGAGAAGPVCVAPHRTGYSFIRVVGNRRYAAHRLAWLYVHSEWPKFDIDHINGRRSDNRIANLRDVPHQINCQNIRASTDNALGLLGVRAVRNKHSQVVPGKFDALICIDGKKRYIGRFSSPELAHEAYINAKRAKHPGNTL